MTNLPNGDFKTEIILSGGTGRATIQNPADVHIKDGIITADIFWSSPYYDLMVVDGKQYTPTSMEGGSRFTVVIPALDTPLNIQAETVAMTTPHMIDYTITVSGREILNAETMSGAENTESPADTSFAVESSSPDYSSMLESLMNKSYEQGSEITVYSAVVGGDNIPAASSGLHPFVTIILGAAAGVAIAFAILAIGKKKK